MGIGEKTSENSGALKPLSETLVSKDERLADVNLNQMSLKEFFQLTGGSLFYCLSAVFVAYGIVKLMGPILSQGGTFREALPCILTLHVYELALLGVFVLIVFRKVVDDAISLAVLMALFLVGTSIALGSVADENISASLIVGLVSVAIAFVKFGVMRRFTRVPFGVLSLLGVVIVMTCNYLGPTLLARSISIEPSQEPARRVLWLFISLIMMIGAVLVLIEAISKKQMQKTQQLTAFLQRPVMVYVFALILFVASGIHLYSMAFISAIERALGDFVPVTAVAALLAIEILRHSDKKLGVMELAISCVPLAVTMLAIQQKSVLASAHFGIGLLCYPPVILALTGLAIAALALFHRWYPLLFVVFAYGLGVILTAGFSPEHPYDLNTHACAAVLIVSLLACGIIVRNQFIWLAGIVILCFGISVWDGYPAFAESYNLTTAGGLAGVCGLGCMVFCLLYGRRMHKALRIFSVLCLAGFILDYLPASVHWRYLVVLPAVALIVAGLWYRTRDVLSISILCAPFFIRLYVLAKRIAYWRLVIVGFLLLVAGTIISLLKRSTRSQMGSENKEKPTDRQRF